MEMNKYKISVVECITYKQFSGEIDAKNEADAINKGKELFLSEYPYYSGNIRLLFCSKL